jgi:uncharacterized protein YegL
VDVYQIASRPSRQWWPRCTARWLVLSVLVLWAAFPAARTAADGEVIVSIASVDESQFPIVRVTLTAERDGRPLGEPSPADVSISVRGSTIPARSVTTRTDASVPIVVVLAVDVSGSMAGDTISRVREAASSLIAALGPQDRAAIISFGTTVRVVQGLTQSKPALQAALSELRAGGDTALYDAAVQAAGLARDSGVERRTVIMLSDGEDFGGRSLATRQAASAAATKSGAVFYAAGVGDSFDRSFLVDLATSTGGRFFEAGGASDIPPLYALISTLLRGQYIVEFDVPATAANDTGGGIISVRFAASTGTAQFSLAPRAPLQTLPPAVTPALAAPTSVAPTEVRVPVKSEAASSSVARVIVVVVASLALLTLAALFMARRRHHRGVPLSAGDSQPPGAPTPDPLPPGVWRATFGLGVDGKELTVFHLGPGPVTIGSEHTCQIVLPVAAEVAPLHARVWHRDGRTMLHHLAADQATAMNGRPVDWAILGEGDTVSIGPFTLTYSEDCTGDHTARDRSSGAGLSGSAQRLPPSGRIQSK